MSLINNEKLRNKLREKFREKDHVEENEWEYIGAQATCVVASTINFFVSLAFLLSFGIGLFGGFGIAGQFLGGLLAPAVAGGVELFQWKNGITFFEHLNFKKETSVRRVRFAVALTLFTITLAYQGADVTAKTLTGSAKQTELVLDDRQAVLDRYQPQVDAANSRAEAYNKAR